MNFFQAPAKNLHLAISKERMENILDALYQIFYQL